MSDWDETREAFKQATEWFVRILLVATGRYDEPGLGEWSIRDLVGHTSRALVTVESYLANPAASAKVSSPVEYFTLILASSGDPVTVAQRGRDAGAALGDNPAVSVEEVANRVLDTVMCAQANALVTTPVGGMRLADYLPTRTFELTVHTCDLACALGHALEVPQLPAAQSLSIISGLTIEVGNAGLLLLSTTGRQQLPFGFTVV
ncbi:maleylpyruvate isomerase N-terminal domain-containing protein [Ferrimicrobium sp.]|uniref:maleylpyruvate isomerase N-terminal domain-containing protein n=1 Tax=Ferrimicrobium sp. TaxID=2926050 RepID=UPI00263040B7|nr:maleylpyruvate isomerase N-terminal domain-containing protein [Ferrimicrobium sp.]